MALPVDLSWSELTYAIDHLKNLLIRTRTLRAVSGFETRSPRDGRRVFGAP